MDTAEVLRKAQRGEWLPARQLRTDVSPALDAICSKAMAVKPEQRYATALELSSDVEKWLADEPVLAYDEPWAVRSRRWMRHHRTLVVSAVASRSIALVVAMGAVVFLLAAEERERTAKLDEANARSLAEKREEEARWNLYVAQMNLVQRDYETNNIDRVRELLEAQVPRQPGATDYRNFEWYYWHRMAHRELLTLKGACGDVVFSPDGRQLALGSSDGTVQVRDAASGQELLVLKGHAKGVSCVAYSPDGRRLASVDRDGELRLWDAATGHGLFTLQGHTCGPYGVVFSPDSRRLVSWGREVRVWDVPTGQGLLTPNGHSQAVGGVALSPDGRRLA